MGGGGASWRGLAGGGSRDHEPTAGGIGSPAAGRPRPWNEEASEEPFAPTVDAALGARYRRWRALMAEATGV